jgi:hypothetical protein
MPKYTILHRWSTTPIAVVEARSYRHALEATVRGRVSLLYADLAGFRLAGASLERADLRGADLCHALLGGSFLRRADLRAAGLSGADLRDAFLGMADLRNADLRRADLRRADLRLARLVGADLRGALLNAAKLVGATLDWRWSVVALEVLRGRIGEDSESAILTDLAFEDDERPFGWLKVLIRHRAQAGRILAVLAEYIRPGDNAPGLLQNMVADLVPAAPDRPAVPASGDAGRFGRETSLSFTDAPATLPMLWSRRASRTAPIELEAP